jgi:hypothetical protein
VRLRPNRGFPRRLACDVTPYRIGRSLDSRIHGGSHHNAGCREKPRFGRSPPYQRLPSSVVRHSESSLQRSSGLLEPASGPCPSRMPGYNWASVQSKTRPFVDRIRSGFLPGVPAPDPPFRNHDRRSWTYLPAELRSSRRSSRTLASIFDRLDSR